MKKNKSRARRILSLLVSLAMTLTLLVPAMAMAADPTTSPYTINIYPNDNTLHPGDDDTNSNFGATAEELTRKALWERFTAYAIFEGVLADDYNGGNSVNKTPNANQLADVVWGSGIKSDGSGYSKLLVALCSDTTTLKSLGVSEDILASLKGKYNDNSEPSAFEIDVTSTNEASLTTLGQLFKRALEMSDYTVTLDSTNAANSKVEANSTAGNTDTTLAKTAAIIARVISDINGDTGNNSVLANAFAKIVADNTVANGVKTYTYLSTTSKTSTWVAKNTTAAPNVPAHWTITGLQNAGYYLIVDNYNSYTTGGTYEPADQDEISKYMIAVFGDQDIYIKSEGATVEKDIVTDTEAGTTAKGTSAEIGDTVTFRLTGTLPENYGEYDSFVYNFYDKLSDGLTFNAGSVKVYAVKPATTEPTADAVTYEIALDTNQTAPTGDGYTLDTTQIPATGKNGGGYFVVKFSDLKKVEGKVVDSNESAAQLNIKQNWKIIVEYTATINADAVVVNPDATGTFTGVDRNKNSTYLEYSNDVNNTGEGGSTGKTTEKTVYVYVYGEDVTKEDGTTNKALDGVGFAMTKKAANSTDTLYAVFMKETSEPVTEENKIFTLNGTETTADVSVTTYTYTLAGWITEAQLNNLTINDWRTAVKGSNLNTATSSTDYTADADYYLAFTTVKRDVYDINAGTEQTASYAQEILLIKGLDNGVEYTLVEKYTPSGYDTMKDVTFTVNETIDTAGNLTALTVTNDTTRTDASFGTANAVDGKNASASGYIPVILDNMPSGYLPGTGGVGTVLFYTGGVILLALGGLHFLRRRRLAN